MTGGAAGDSGTRDYVRAVLNIVDDFATERDRLTDSQKAVINILEDFAVEKQRLEDTQRAVFNFLDDLGVERERVDQKQQEVLRADHVIRASLREKEVLLKEIHHRVKNNLQVISSLLNLQARYLADPAARAIFNTSQNRVQSIALVHEKLYQSADLSHIDFGQYLADLLDNLLVTNNAAERNIGCRIDMGSIRLAVDLAIPCGLIVNELVTNCLKHAFPTASAGTIRIRLQPAGPDHVELVVSDDGIGLPADLDPRSTRSLGLDLVFTFAEQIDAKVEVTASPGASFRFTFATERR